MENNKPVSLTTKEWLIRNMSTKMNVPERTIEAVINHQFESGHKALTDSYTLEFAGWGKFIFNKKKAKNKMAKMVSQKAHFQRLSTDESITAQKRHSAGLKLLTTLNNIEILKPKLENENTFVEDI